MKTLNPKKQKKQKKMKEHKSQDERKNIVSQIKMQFSELGIDITQYDSLMKFNDILNEYEKEKLETGFSGRYYIPELNRYIEYILPVDKSIRELVRLTVS